MDDQDIYKKLLTYFLISKNKIIKDLTGKVYLTKRDFDEVKSWPPENIEKIFKFFGWGKDASICPWCILHSRDDIQYEIRCKNCNYGKRHGKCITGSFLNRDSKYVKILVVLFKKKILNPVPFPLPPRKICQI